MTVPVRLIAAHNQRGYMGKDNKLMYHLPYDMKNFKRLTTGAVVVMGRKTFESMGKKTLPHRHNMIVTSGMTKAANGMLVSGDWSWCDDLEEAIYLAKIRAESAEKKEVWVIGGAEIYSQAIPYCTDAVITLIEDDEEGDVKFPTELFNQHFEEVEDSIETVKDNGIEIEITSYERKLYSEKAQGLLWNVVGDRKERSTIEREGTVVRITSIDSAFVPRGKPLVNLHVAGSTHGFRFGSAKEAEVALQQLNNLMNGL